MKTVIIFILFFHQMTLAQLSEKKISQELKAIHKTTQKTRDSLSLLIKKCYEESKGLSDSALLLENYLRSDSLWNLSDQNDISELRNDFEFCSKHPYSLTCFQLMQKRVSSQQGKNFYNEFENIYNNASDKIKASDIGREMAEKLKYFKQSKVGSLAPLFKGNDIDVKHLSIDSYLNEKIVLLDFWASWCAPCLIELPFLLELYSKYKFQNFEIISISIDDDLGKWRKAVETAGISEWKHFSTFMNKSSAREDYFVYGIPHKVLVDKDGRIIGKWKASGELNKRELREMLEQIFGF